MPQIVDRFLRPDELHCLRGDFVSQVHWRRVRSNRPLVSMHYRLGSEELAERAGRLVGASLADLRLAQLISVERGAEVPLHKRDDRPWRYVEIMVQPATAGGEWVVHETTGCTTLPVGLRQAVVSDATERQGVSEVTVGERWTLLLGFGPK